MHAGEALRNYAAILPKAFPQGYGSYSLARRNPESCARFPGEKKYNYKTFRTNTACKETNFLMTDKSLSFLNGHKN